MHGTASISLEGRKALHEWIQELRVDFPTAVQRLSNLLAQWPDLRSELLVRLGDQVRTDTLRELFRVRPDLLPDDDATFLWLIEHSPRLLEVWVEIYPLTPHQAWHLLQVAQHQTIPGKLLEQALKALPDGFRSLYEHLPESERRKLEPWRDLLFQDAPDSLIQALRDWLEGRPVWHRGAFEILQSRLATMPETAETLVSTLPDMIQKTLDPSRITKIRRSELIWLLHHPDTWPESWLDWIVENIMRLGDPILWALAENLPTLRERLSERGFHARGWLALDHILTCLRERVTRTDQQRLRALLADLGVQLRFGRRQVLASARELAHVLAMMPLTRFVHRLRHFKHEQDITRHPEVLRRLLHERKIRRTVVPHIYESLVEEDELRAIIRQWVQQHQKARKRARHRLKELIERNLQPRLPEPFRPDPFQTEALSAFEQGKDVLVTAPTGSGKTWIAEQAMQRILAHRGRSFYATPLRALSYQKLRAFREKFGWEQVGVLTGEYRENASAPIIVGTTEIVRNLLLDGVFFDLLVLDEAHYIGDVERGSAWEESILLAPSETRLILLSATIPNAEEIATWLRSLGRDVVTVTRPERPVPLEFLTWMENGPELGLHTRGHHPSLREMLRTLKQWQMTPALIFVGRRDDAMVMAYEAAHILSSKSGTRIQGLHHPLSRLLQRGVGVHHAGLSYAFRETVENMMEEGSLDFIFCTSSLAHGIDAPVRSTVLYDVSPFWDRSELQHALGRAGRRGFDQVGFAIVALPSHNIREVIRALRLGPQPLSSAFAPHDAAVAALVARYGIDGTIGLARKSLRVYQGDPNVSDQIVQAIRRLVHLGFMERDGSLTDMGQAITRLMHPNATGVVLTLRMATRIGPEDAAIIASFFSNERPPRRIRRYLRHPLIPLMSEAAEMADLQEIDPRDGARRAWIIRQWLRGQEQALREMVGVEAEGDLERLRVQVVELLRKMENLELSAAIHALAILDPHFATEHPDWSPEATPAISELS